MWGNKQRSITDDIKLRQKRSRRNKSIVNIKGRKTCVIPGLEMHKNMMHLISLPDELVV